MFINKTPDGRNNICGVNIARLRKEMHISQRELADRLQLVGLDVDKNAVQRIESGQRFLTDIELLCFQRVLKTSFDALYHQENARPDHL
ncbi:MAG: helix-turn-helix transcriptional regulator [Clostridia bacterium]|nr:helix-turn-helix transcriptional regulator [Clostridia bacterium]